MSVAIVDSFKKIKLLPDGTELVADKTSDTLTLKAGTGVNFLVSADGTAGTSPGQGPVIEIYNTGQGLAVLDDVLKFGNVSNQSMTVGAATIDSLLIDNSQVIQTDDTKDLVWRTQTTTFTLVPAGTTPPTPTGVGPYSVQFPLALQGSAPVTGVWYFVADHANPNYNGVYKATASSTTSLTLEYLTNPGTYGIQATSLSSNGSVVQINFASQTAIPFTPFIDNAGDYVTVSGFTSTGSVYNGTYPVKTAGLTYVTFDSGNNVSISSGYGVVTKPTSAATAAGTNNTIGLTNNLIIASTQGLKLPIGTTAQRPAGPLPLSGFIRYNTDLGSFEGYVGTAGWASLGGVRSVDGYTYISAESTPGNSDDTLRFYTSTNAPGSFLSLTIDKDNTTILTKGFVLPKGNNTTERPASPVAGMIRYNTTDNVFEGYANSAWASLGGVRSVDGQTLIRAETSATASNDRLDFITSLNTSVTSTTDIGDIITVNSTANLYIGQPIEFVGTIVGGVTAGVTYYVKTIASLNITVSTDPALGTTQAISPDTSGNPMFIVTKAFTADKDNVTFSSKGLVIPVGNTAGRPATPITGHIRFNSETTQFEGYIGANWSSLGGVRSVDGLTYITPETSPANSDDTLHFYAATGVSTTAEAAQLNSSGFTLLDNRYVSIRESASNGVREIRIKAPAALDSTGGSYTLTMPTKLGVPGNLLALNNATGTLEFITADSFGGSRIIVSATGGDDLNDGINQPVKTIKRGLQLASALVYTQVGSTYVPNGKKIVVSVANGDYYEDNPLIVADNISVLGAGLRSAILRPLNANKDLLRVRNGTYFGEFTFRDHLTGGGVTGVPDFTWDYAVAFDNPKDTTTSRVGYTLPTTKPTITTSPYIQAVSLISFLGGNGAYVDGSLVNTPNVTVNQIEVENPVSGPSPEQGKSMVANAFTMLSFGGTGWRITNDAYAQIVSCFQIFMLHGSYCLSGGYLSITNSATNFGSYALRSGGYSPNAFQFDKGYVVGTGLITGGIQTITAIGFGRAPTVHYITRFRTPDYKISYDLIKYNRTVIQDAVINTAGTSGWSFSFLKTTVTNFTTSTNVFTASSTANFTVGERVEFTGTTFAGVTVGNTYYIKTIPSNTTFTLSTSSDISTTYTFGSTVSGSMTMAFKHDTAKSNRDVGLVVDAVAYDLYTGGNQQGVLAGQSYYTAGILTSGLTGQVTQCLSMLRVARGVARSYVDDVITNTSVLGGYGLVVNWSGGTSSTLTGATITPLSATFTSTISGNVLTITSAVTGTIAIGMALSGGSVTAGTYIVGTNGVGTGNGSTWILNQTATGTPTAARSIGYTTGDVVTIWAGNSNATATVTASAGVVTGLAVANPGTGYSAAGTGVTASVASSIVGKFDLIIGVLADYNIAPTAIQYGTASDVSSTYIPSGTTYSFNAATGVNASTNTITVPYTGESLYLGNTKKVTYSSNGNAEIAGLDSGQSYFLGGVSDSGSVTSFNLYYDDGLKLIVDITSVGSGTHQFIASQKDFYISGIVSSHNSYQSLSITASATITSFAPGQLVTGTNSLASGYVYSWDNITKTLVVSLNEVLIGGSTIRQTFTTSDTIGVLAVTGTATVSNLYSSTFTVEYSDSAILTLNNAGGGGFPGGIYNTNPGIVSGGSGNVSTEIWLHRPSIVNSSGHTWEYAGSGTDYNALPQNGGQSIFAREQWSDSPGRVYTSGTNELGDFKVGKFIVAENRTGNVTFTNTVTVSSLNVLKLALGSITISEISNDVDLGDNEQGGPSDSRLSTQKAMRSYFKNHLGPFIDKSVSTNAVPNAIPQLNSSGQLDVSQIPAIRTFATYRSFGYNSKTTLVEEIPANDILNGDIGTELYSTVQLTLSATVTASRGAYVLQANTGAEGYLVSDVTASNVITVGSVNSNFFKYTNGVAVNTVFNTTVANTLTIAGDSTPSVANGTVYPTAVGTIATGIEINYVLSNAGASQYLVLDPAGTYSFNTLTVGTGATLVSGTIYKIVTLGSGVNWSSLAVGPTFTDPSTGVTTSTPTAGYYFTYNGTTPTHTTTAGTADIYRVYSANENYYATLAGVSGGSLYRNGVLISGAIAGGSGYVGTSATVYYSVPLTNVSSSGSNAIADITVTNGIVTNVDVRRGGTGYAVNDTLSASNAFLGGSGTSFVFTVGTVEKRLYVTIENGSKIVANAIAPNFIQDNNATIKTITLTSTTVLNFNNANTSGGGGNVNVTNNSIDITSHGFTNGDPVRLTTISFGGLTTNTITYYVSVLNANSFRLYTNYNLSTVYTITGSGAGGGGSGQLVRYAVDTVADTFVLAAHGYTTGTAVKIVGSTLPTVNSVALTTNTFYFVGSVTTNSFTLHASRGNALTSVNGLTTNPIDLNGTGSGTMSVVKQNVTINSIVNTSSVSTGNWSNLTTNNVDASNIISGTISTTRLGSGTANSSTFLRGDSSWQYAVQGVKEVLTPLTLTGSSYSLANSAVFPGVIHGTRYLNNSTPTKVGTVSPWSVTYFFTSTTSPTVPGQYLVTGATTSGFNGTFAASASTSTSITLTYISDPGTWAGGTVTIYLETGNLLYVSSIVSGTIVPGMTLTGNGISTNPTIVANVSGVGSTGASVWTISANLNINGGANITGTSTDNIYYGNVAIDIDKVDGNQTLTPIVTNYTNLGVASFNKTQFYTGQTTTGDLGQVYVKDGVIDAIKLNGQTEAFYRNPANLTSSVGTDKGGTNFSSYAVGDILYATGTSGAAQLTKLNIGAANRILTSTGSAPQWSADLSVPGNVTVAGNLIVNGITTTVNSSTLTVDDKNLELGSVAAVTGFVATLSTGTAIITLTTGTTNGLIPGMALTKTGGAGVFGASPVILTVDSLTQITASVQHDTLGSINFDIGGVTDLTANGGGITLKGATDKTISYDNTNGNWTSSENWNIPTGKTFKINNTTVLSSTQVLGLTPGGTTAGDLVTINATQTLTNKTFTDNVTTFQDDANTLKKHQFNATSIGGSGATFSVTTSAGGAVTAVNASPAAGGNGYAVNDVLTLEGPGAPTTKVTITVNTITAGGVIATFTTSTLPGTSAGYTASQTNVTASSAIGSAITTRVYTVPSASTTLVGTDSFQTLTNKTLTAPILNDVVTLSLRDTAAAFDLTIASTSNTALTADRTLTLDVNNAARTIDIAGNLTLANNFTTSGNFALTLTQTAATNVTLPTSGTLATLAGTESLSNKTLAAATTTLKDAANRSAVFTLSAGTGLQIGNITVTNGAVQASPSPSTVAAGTGYAVGDRVYLNSNPTTGSGAVFQVASVTATGAVSGLSFVAGGTLYAPQSGTLAAQTFTTTASTVDTETALRTYNLPSSDGSDVLVTQDATQTLTNKTLTTPTIGTSMIVPLINGSNLASGQLTLRSTTSGTKSSAGVLIDENIASNGTTSGGLVVTGGIGLSLDLWSGGSGYFATSVRSPLHTTNSAANLVLNTNNGTSTGSITINTGVNGNIAVTPNGTGAVNLGDTTASGIITTGAAAATLTLSTNNGTNSGTIVVNAGANTDIVATANGTGNVKLNTLTISNAGTVTSGTWQGSIVGATYGGTGVNNGSNTITIGGNISTANSFTTSGAAALTLTLSSATATNATFPATGNITLAYTGHKLSAFAATTSAELAGVISDETGTGVLVFGTSPSFTTDIRTPTVTTASAVNLILSTNTGTTTGSITIVTGANGNINITPNGTGNVNLGNTAAAGLLTTGAAVNLTLNTNSGTNSGNIIINAGANGNIAITPNGTGTVLVPTINNLTITNSTGTLTIGSGKTATVSNTLTFTGTDSSSVAFGAGGTVAYTGNNLSVFAATTSAQLAGVISDETGTGKLTFATSPTFTTDITTPTIYGGIAGATNLVLRSTSDATKGQVYIDETTAASSTITGALRVGGGVGIGGKLYTGGDISAGSNDVYAGRFRAGDGSAASPSFAFNSDGAVDTGFYWGGDGYINWTNNGVFKGQFRPDGTAQIGTVLTTSITTGADATAGTIQGTWTLTGTSKMQATYADLAEYYEADEEYEVGTVLVFGGEKEITTTNLYADRRVAGVVSATAAYLMNQDCPGIKTSIALQGRVPVKVVGTVKKGDLLVTSEFPGYAVVNNDPKTGTIIGKAISAKDSTDKGTVEVSVGRT
jgi:hypothetical protein